MLHESIRFEKISVTFHAAPARRTQIDLHLEEKQIEF